MDDDIVQSSMNESVQVAIGSILGDGCLKQLSKRARASQLYISQHSSKLPYLEWLHSKLSEDMAVNPIRKKRGYDQFYFMTRPNKTLGNLRLKFYPQGKKVIPKDIKNLLVTPLSLAVWYMDDGTLDNRSHYHYNAMFATYSFSSDGCICLARALEGNFGIKASVSKCSMRGKVYPRLYVVSACMDNFIRLINPHIHPVFRYKVANRRASSSGKT